MRIMEYLSVVMRKDEKRCCILLCSDTEARGTDGRPRGTE